MTPRLARSLVRASAALAAVAAAIVAAGCAVLSQPQFGAPMAGAPEGTRLAPPELKKMPILHAEFEGGGVWVLYNCALAALALVVVGTVLCAIPVIGWIACLIAAALALLVVGIGAIVALNDTGSPTDVDPTLARY